MCTLLTMDQTKAIYNNLINVILRPAGRSRSFSWIGPGNIDNIPLHVPRPLFIPRWVPRGRSEYVAKWVPTMPTHVQHTHAHQPPSKFSGFGAPKSNSEAQHINFPTYGLVPPDVVSSSASETSQYATGYAPLQVTSSDAREASTQQHNDYAPHADDVISGTRISSKFPTTVGVSLTVAEPTLTKHYHQQQNFVTPQTSIRSQASGPRAAPLGPIVSDLVYDEATLSEFRAPDPSSVVSVKNASNALETFTGSIVYRAVADETLKVTKPASPANTDILYGEGSNSVVTKVQANHIMSPQENSDLVFIVEPSDNLTTLTTTHFLEGKETLQSSQDISSSYQVPSTIVSLPLEFLQREVITRQNDVAFVDVSQSLNFEPDPEYGQSLFVSDYLELDQDFKPSQPFDINDFQNSEGFHPNPEFISIANFQPNPKNIKINLEGVLGESTQPSLLLKSNENFQFNSEYEIDENLQSKVRTSQDIKFKDEFESNRTFQSNRETVQVASGPRATSHGVAIAKQLPVAPPATPPLVESRSLSLPGFIPHPVSLPIDTSVLRLDLPSRGRQTRVLSPPLPFSHLQLQSSQLPFSAGTHPRPGRRNHSRRIFLR
ncbi:uncharacterized protein [Cherax quadricarinatus]